MDKFLMTLDIIIAEPSKNEFSDIAAFSYENFIAETAKSNGENEATLKTKFGGPPIDIRSDDLWLVVKYKNQSIGYLWIQINEVKKKHFDGTSIFLRNIALMESVIM